MTDISSVAHDVRHVVLTVRGRIDAVAAPALREELDTVLATGCRALVVDLTGVTFLDSAGLAALVKGRKDAHAKGATMRLVPPASDDSMRVFRLTGFDEIFDFVAADGTTTA